jgi:crotonobetainyl-CoA:carnitine CoA-transferase CaiB-like acyl-CoA transferase
MGALDGIRVIDFSRILAGPWATQTLADLGAEIIKIEHPEGGDDTRKWGPPFLKAQDGTALSDAAYFAAANRNKKSVAIDIATAEGQDLARRLVREADVVVENFKVRGLAKYDLDYESLKGERPGLVYCSITGFGQDGPRAGEAGYDLLIQGMGGLMSVTGNPDGGAGGGPLKVGVALVDVITGLYAATAILAALRHRDATGKGQHIDLALLDTVIAAMANQSHAFLASGQTPPRLGNAHPSIVPYESFASSDGHFILAVGNDSQFRKLCTVIGLPELAEDARFSTNTARVSHRGELIPVLRALFRTRSTSDWVSLLTAEGVPCGPINTVAQVFEDPQVRHRGVARKVPHADAGDIASVANPIRMSESPVSYRLGPPVLGEHTAMVLKESLHLDDAALDRLKLQGVIRI